MRLSLLSCKNVARVILGTRGKPLPTGDYGSSAADVFVIGNSASSSRLTGIRRPHDGPRRRSPAPRALSSGRLEGLRRARPAYGAALSEGLAASSMKGVRP